MKLLFAFLIASAILGVAEAACGCYPDQPLASNVGGVTIGPPSDPPGFGTPCAPIQCNTTITFSGNFPGTQLPAGANITILTCNNLTSANTVTLFANGVQNKVFASCSGLQTITISTANVFTFSYKLTAPIGFLVVLNPIPQTTPTTLPPTVPTTPVYAGPFKPYNPAISRMDLTIGLDISADNQQYYNYTKDMITNIVKYFTYSDDYVRLSFMTFDPYAASGTGTHPLWTQNVASMTATLNNMPFYPAGKSLYFKGLDLFFFQKITGDPFQLRNNTQKVFIIFTGTDGKFEDGSTIMNQTNTNIINNDIKFIFVNMNTALSTADENSLLNSYPALSTLGGVDSSKPQWYDYQLGANNAEDLLNKYYFNGNHLCNVVPTINTQISGGPPGYTYSLPIDATKFYCNYMNDQRIYINTQADNTNSSLQVYFPNYDLNNGNDYIRIAIDGVEVSTLTGRFGSAYYCLQGTNITVTFQSQNGLIYHGYQSVVKGFGSLAECKTTVPGTTPTIFIDHTKRYQFL